MHRLIMDCVKGMYVDHINHNRTDNRKKNLRVVTTQQNTMNMLPKTDKYPGVYWEEDKKRWRAMIKYNYKLIPLGRYKTFEEAKQKRIEAELKYFGEYGLYMSEKISKENQIVEPNILEFRNLENEKVGFEKLRSAPIQPSPINTAPDVGQA
jgi:hypothetical protein